MTTSDATNILPCLWYPVRVELSVCSLHRCFQHEAEETYKVL